MAKAIDADLTGKTCIVTGANTGIGRQVAENLARLGASVTLACRSQERGEAALQHVARRSGSERLALGLVDLSSQASIRDFARRFCADHEALHVLVNNAAVWSDRRRETEDGIELTFATNVLGYFLLTDGLLELMKRSAPARIVNVASDLAGDFRLDDLGFETRPFVGTSAYAQSKACTRMLTWELARRLEGTGVSANACHPGFVSTELGRNGNILVRIAFKLFAKSRRRGADTPTWLAASSEVEGRSGEYFVGRAVSKCRFADPSWEKSREALWARCEELVGSGAAARESGAS